MLIFSVQILASSSSYAEAKKLKLHAENATVEEVITNDAEEITSAELQGQQQEIEVSGIVTDTQTDEPLPGVNIVVQGTNIGTTTDMNGEYSIEAPADATLVFSFVGYQEVTVDIESQEQINVEMEQAVTELEEVVAIGYGTQKKVNLTGSVASADVDQMEKKPVTVTSQALAGEISGVSVSQPSGNPGDNEASIRIRGLGTFSSAGNSPLVLIDGTPGSINSVNPNDIEEISVLKDAASASIYGSRAANGVILINTKKGEEGKMQITYNSYIGKREATELAQFVDSWIYARALNENRENIGQSRPYTGEDIEKFKSGDYPDEYPNKHHYEDLMTSGNGLQTKHNLSFTGGSSGTQWMFSSGYLRENGIVEQNYNSRYDMRLNLDHELNNDFRLNVKLAGYQSNREEPVEVGLGPLYQIINGAVRLNSTIPGRKSDGSYGFIENQAPEAFMDANSFMKENNKHFRGNGTLEWSIVNSLKIIGKIGYEWNGNRNKSFTPEVEFAPDEVKGPSKIDIDRSENYDLTTELLLDYDITIGNHDFHVLGGFSQETLENEWVSAYRDNFPNDQLYELNAGSAGNMQNNGSSSIWKLRSYFGRFNYSYQDKYLLEANVRYDGSSRFAEGNRFGLFPSFSGAWRISEEGFFKNAFPEIDNLKLRGSYGTLGNQQIGIYPYQKTLNLGHDYVFGGSVASGARVTTLPYEDITWETTKMTDVGLDITILGGKLSFTTDYFYKKTEDILYNISVSDVLGMSPSAQNAGAVENKGWDFNLTHRNKIGDFSYSINPNFSVVSNKVLELANVEEDIGNGLFVGEPMNAIYGYETEGLFIDQNDIDNYPEQNYNAQPGLIRFKDISGPDGKPDGKVTAAHDRKVIGSRMPDYTYGMGLTASYKGVDLYMQLQGEGGMERTPSRWMYAFWNMGDVQQWQWEGRWTQENPNRNAAYPRFQPTGSDSPSFAWPAEYWLLNATYLRIKNVQIGYTFPSGFISGVEQLRIYIGGRNLITFDNYQEGWDPEMEMMYGGTGHYPPTRLLTFGVNVNF